MAQLKDLLVTGPSRLIGDVYVTNLQVKTLLAPTASNGTTYGAGTSGYVLMSNGSSSYWGQISTSNISGFGSYKTTQSAVSDPTASGTSTSFIKTISQNANGVITVTKANLPTASTTGAGIIQIGTEATNAAAGNHTHTFASLTSKPTTISGYGITDALTIGTSSTTAAAGNHTHTTTLATDTGTSTVTLASAGKYKLTAGGTSVIFTMPTSNNYSHPNSGVTAGTYRKVTVDAQGHVTAGENPTTLSGYGITDAKISNGTITLGDNSILPLVASDITGKADKSATVSTIAWDTQNKKLTKTINGSTSDVVTASTLKTDLGLSSAMLFMGTVGSSGATVTSLDTAATANQGYTYKVITDGTYGSVAAKIGDVLISNGSSWVLVPSGDEPSGTVTSVTISGTSPITVSSSAAITSSGTRTISLADNYGDTKNPYAAKTKNYVLAAPSDADGSPLFRALIADDIPTLTPAKVGITISATGGVSYGDTTYKYTHPTSAGNKHIPSGGSSGQFLKYSSSGTATWANLPVAATDTQGIMQVGTGLAVSSGTVSVSYGTAASTALQGNANLVKLNGTNKTAASIADFYAPTSSGSSGQYLQSGGTDSAPTWASLPTASTNAAGIIQIGTGATNAAAGDHSHTITANATDGLWDLSGTNGTNAVTYAVGAYSAKGTAARFYTTATNPTLTARLNYDGYFYATKLYSGGTEVLTAHRTYDGFTGKPTGNQTPAFGETFTIQQISQSTTGAVTGTDRTVTIPSLPTASTSAAGIIQIGTGATNAAAGNHTHDYLTTIDFNSNKGISQSVNGGTAAEAVSQAELQSAIFVVSNNANGPSDTSVIWLKPVS